jgi:hypothetical protein
MKLFYFLIAFLFFLQTAKAQIFSSAETIKTGVEDGKTIIKAYITPLEKLLSSATSNGFVNNIKIDKKIEFSFNIQLVGSIVSKTDKTYNYNDLSLVNVKPSNPNNTIAQTISGSAQTIELETKQTYRTLEGWQHVEKPLLKFNSPEGSGVSEIALPLLNFGVGVYYTNINVRLLPKIKIPTIDATIYSVGASIQHSVNQYFGFLSNLPINFSIIAGYQNVVIDYFLDIKPEEDRYEIKLSENGPYDNQIFKIKTNTIPLEIAVSKKNKYFTYIAGFGLNMKSSNVYMLGNYPVYLKDPTNTTQIVVKDVVDPFEYNQTHNELKLDLALIYNYKIYSVQTNFAFAKYKAFSLGFGVKF